MAQALAFMETQPSQEAEGFSTFYLTAGQAVFPSRQGVHSLPSEGEEARAIYFQFPLDLAREGSSEGVVSWGIVVGHAYGLPTFLYVALGLLPNGVCQCYCPSGE